MVCGLHRKIRPTQLLVELGGVVAIGKIFSRKYFGPMGPKKFGQKIIMLGGSEKNGAETF